MEPPNQLRYVLETCIGIPIHILKRCFQCLTSLTYIRIMILHCGSVNGATGHVLVVSCKISLVELFFKFVILLCVYLFHPLPTSFICELLLPLCFCFFFFTLLNYYLELMLLKICQRGDFCMPFAKITYF